eukprot:2396643-Pyramimonas_sp.AAC.1
MGSRPRPSNVLKRPRSRASNACTSTFEGFESWPDHSRRPRKLAVPLSRPSKVLMSPRSRCSNARSATFEGLES